jgi:hypothetical protein
MPAAVEADKDTMADFFETAVLHRVIQVCLVTVAR